MITSNEQIKKKAGRPPKNGKQAQSSAARSRDYRRRKQDDKDMERIAAERLGDVLARMVIATSDRGVLDVNVSRVLYDNIHAVGHIRDALTQGYVTLMYKDTMLFALACIDNEAEEAAFQDHMDRTDNFRGATE